MNYYSKKLKEITLALLRQLLINTKALIMLSSLHNTVFSTQKFRLVQFANTRNWTVFRFASQVKPFDVFDVKLSKRSTKTN